MKVEIVFLAFVALAKASQPKEQASEPAKVASTPPSPSASDPEVNLTAEWGNTTTRADSQGEQPLAEQPQNPASPTLTEKTVVRRSTSRLYALGNFLRRHPNLVLGAVGVIAFAFLTKITSAVPTNPEECQLYGNGLLELAANAYSEFAPGTMSSTTMLDAVNCKREEEGLSALTYDASEEEMMPWAMKVVEAAFAELLAQAHSVAGQCGFGSDEPQ